MKLHPRWVLQMALSRLTMGRDERWEGDNGYLDRYVELESDEDERLSAVYEIGTEESIGSYLLISKLRIHPTRCLFPASSIPHRVSPINPQRHHLILIPRPSQIL